MSNHEDHEDYPLGMTPAIMRQLVIDQAIQTEKLSTLVTTVGEIKTHIVGNGKPGLEKRTDRLEQKDKSRGRIFWIVVAASATVIIQTVAALAVGF
jgi:hypothetical protein